MSVNSVQSSVAPPHLDAAAAVARAKALAPRVRALAGEAESGRRVPEPLIRDFIDAGLVRLLTPRRFGGHELGLDAFIDATLEIARADASVGWCFSFLNIHSWLMAMMPEAAQQEVWGADPDACIANVNAPGGQAVPTEGGHRLTGVWQWASGIQHCGWALLAGIVPSAAGAEAGPPDVRLFLVSRADFQVKDTWFVAGQRGTGSNHVVVNDVFVPEHRNMALGDVREGRSPGSRVHASPLYQLPFLPPMASSLVAPIIGAALGAYETWRELMRTRYTTFSREQVATLSHQQIRMAEVSAELEAAQLLLRRALDTLRPGGMLTLQQRVQVRRDYAYAATLCVRAVERLYTASGAGANFESNPLQRYWRDIHAMAVHAGINFDAAGENFGRLELGLGLNPKDPLF
ncbi:acyl-CoA dehydrogenase family protein [Pyxidicoccus xibeiensis]|uniref:acyl-CoA dehydrogenase family protein n=1 Tax=Pyxidicoccus xibeiensis TaxID=2906759 RepID=UPI0020A77E8C|nr:acyl-CoA dehydrogenase family protein [Pyxidicoccus xibeiensis]MCP3141076.1 acyl-CoA dehydrogenase family protein [Pyxidicoccus xibeiensis]